MKIQFFEWSQAETLIFSRIKPELELKEIETFFSSEIFTIDKVTDDVSFISIFVDSRISEQDLDTLKSKGIKGILLRCAGVNMLDTNYAKTIGLNVYRIASYSPESIAEHVFALLLPLCRKIFVDRRKHISVSDGRDISQMGMTLRGKAIGFYGFGQIGQMTAKIAKYGFGMEVLYFDPYIDAKNEYFVKVNSLSELFEKSDIVSVHAPLMEKTANTVNKDILSHANGVILINTARGQIINTNDALEALLNGNLLALGFDVVGENDSYKDLPVQDNIILTQHTAFFTEEAIESILRQTFENVISPKSENII
jgi:D-lactate dehydrogenase